MLVLGLDFETTGLDVDTCEVIEVGAVQFDWERKMPVRFLSELVRAEQEITPEVTAITGICAEDLSLYGVPSQTAMELLDDLIDGSDYVVAHNGAAFDKPVYESWVDRETGYVVRATPWIDTKTDIVYPAHIETRRLGYLAAEHGFLNPFAHRAVFDVLTMLRVMSNYDIQAIIARAAEPTVYVGALVSFDNKDKAKDRGYKWHSARKLWWKAFKESDYQAELAANVFPLQVLSFNPEAASGSR